MNSEPEVVCATCGFDLWLPIGKLAVSKVGLYDDGRFPGRCIVALEAHYEHLDELPPSLLSMFWRDSARVGEALRNLVGAPRINYAVLGNVASHVHAHVIPRGSKYDINPGRPPWENPGPRVPLEPKELQEIRESLGAALMRP